jgi:short-subunit dehydrogenase involved in D-alanine esterification of teichoic acids
MSFQYKKVLVLGATSGIGWALAAKFVETGTSVIVSGRRKEKLEQFVTEYGAKGDVDSVVFDITDFKAIPGFAADMFKKHPDIDCIWINSGLQRSVNWAEPEQVDTDKIDLEMSTNYIAPLHLSKAFLPYLQKQAPTKTSMMYTTSGLALVPILGCPNYCATKAAMHHMILAMRQQLKDASSNVKIIELYPPAVQTELHDVEHGDKGKHIGMPLKDFTEEAFDGLCSESNEQVAVQAVKSFMGFNGWEQERQATFQKMCEAIKSQRH